MELFTILVFRFMTFEYLGAVFRFGFGYFNWSFLKSVGFFTVLVVLFWVDEFLAEDFVSVWLFLGRPFSTWVKLITILIFFAMA